MINRLRRQFIAIAMTSVTLVLLLMAAAINVFNFLSTDGALGDTLRMIYENQGMIPQFPGGRPEKPPGGQFTPETPYSTRYFVLYYSGDGTLDMADLKHIAAVTEEDADRFLSTAIDRGEGMGYTGQYKYYVVRVGQDRYMAIFLDCQRELYFVRTFAVISLLLAAACAALVYLLIWFFSKKAIEPTIKSVEKQKQFITDASHELKTPLTVIATSLKVLELEVGRQKWIDKAQAQTEKLSELVNDLVSLARLDEEKPPLRFARFDISGVALETAVQSALGWRSPKRGRSCGRPISAPDWTERSWTSFLTGFTGRTAPGPSRRGALEWVCPLPGALWRPIRAPSGRSVRRRA